jgi:heme/copper-type cytochrome/quinol oxidase subunit 3
MSEQSGIQSNAAPSFGVDNRKMAIWALISSEVIFFASLITTYMVNRGRSVTGPFPADALNVPLTAFNTFVLICSSLTMVTALARIQRGDQRGVRRFLIFTALLGLLFLGGQATEFTLLATQDKLSLSQNLFGATFFTLTGFHGAHVLAGVIWIVILLVRAYRGGVTQQNHIAVELVGLYWHFVDVVWIIIFTMVYLI